MQLINVAKSRRMARTQATKQNRLGKRQMLFLTIARVEGNVNVLVWVVGAVDLHKSRGGEHQNVCARRVLRGAQLGRLHVQSCTATKHRTC